MKFKTSILFTLFCALSFAKEPSPAKLQTLYNSLDPKSIFEHLAFYQLYKDWPQGKQALQTARELLCTQDTPSNGNIDLLSLNPAIVDTLVSLVNKQPDPKKVILTEEVQKTIQELARHLPNRKLKGYEATSEEEILKLEPQEIDLARGIFLSQLGNDKNAMQQALSYEATIDLMALQLLAKLPKNATPEIKIAYMNQLIFEEMGFRFPPHSLYAKDVDIYTFLPSVLDSRRGVCLGVSILYICLAQRLDLPLEMVTPPGHIYVRYKDKDQIINIETTARGIHLDCEEYLGIDTRSLEMRNIKEVIGLAHFNLAATFWHREDPQKTVEAYLKAKPYLENDMQLKELLGFAYLLAGKKEEGEELLKQVKNHLPEHAVSPELMAEEYLNGLVGVDGIAASFKPVDEKRLSIVEKRDALKQSLNEYPRFASGIFSYAITWLQLHRYGEALEALERYHLLDPSNATAEYYLAALYTERYDYNKAWEHLLLAEKLTGARDHHPKALKELRKHLSSLAPN